MEQEEKIEQSRYDSTDYWFRWLRSAEKASKTHREDAAKAWAEYENQKVRLVGDKYDKSTERVYPIYWVSSKTIEPAYYSRTPKPVVIKEFDVDDAVANTMSYIDLHLAKYLLRVSNFDAVMSAAVQDFIHADKATTQIVYDTDSDEQEERIPLTPGAENQYLNAQGQPVEGEVLKDEQGYFQVSSKVTPKNQKIYLAPIPYDEILHTPEAKTQEEIKDIAYKFCMTQEEAEERFKREDGSLPTITWKEGRSPEAERSDIKDNQPLGKYLEGWEIYCKEERKVYWISEQCKTEFLDKKDDPYGFRNFFPSPPFIIGSKPSKSLYPTPVYIQLAPTLMQLHEIYGKVFSLIQGIRRRAIVDGASPELIQALNDLSDQEFVAATNLNKIVEKGGIQNMVFYVPVQELVSAIGELQALEDTFKNLVYEWFGVPDIIRGVGDPVETAAAQEIKQNAAHDRFKYAKKQVRQLARDSLEMMVDLALQVFDDEKIARTCGIQYKPEHQQNFAQALQALRSDEERFIRIDLETDSLSYSDEQLSQQERLQVAQTVNNGLKEIAAISQTNPEYVPTALRTLLLVVEGMNGGIEFSNGVRQAVQQLVDKANAPQEQGPPPPDYEMIKLQLQEKEIMLKESQIGIERQRFKIEVQNLSVKNDLEMQKIALENKKQDIEYEIKSLTTQLKAMETAANAENKKSEQEIKAVKESFSQQLQAAYLKLDEVTSMLKIKEQFMEEARLKQQNLETRVKEISAEVTKPRESAITTSSHQPPVIHIHNGGAKQFSMKRGKDGSLEGTSRTLPEGGDE